MCRVLKIFFSTIRFLSEIAHVHSKFTLTKWSLSISSLSAAGLGNWLSDLCGIGTASYVERFATSLGFVIPPVTADQMNSRSMRWATALGRACGITLGCFLGMLPLLWFKCEDKDANKADSSR
ncbi:unnamed protein product [Dicrocoelium dendriticum]|nr:unnamed protein product [Dicrocoelium dendriticum]